MGKYGRKHVISDNILDYNIGIIGESGIGKSTMLKNVYEKLCGDDGGYIALDIGKEDGHKAINGIVTETFQTFDGFLEFVNDVATNKQTDYPELKAVVIDTIDQLFEIAEDYVVRKFTEESNAEKRENKEYTINSCHGGYGNGQGEVIRLVLDAIWKLKNVGVAFSYAGHTKKREQEDPVTGETYVSLTTNAAQRYFNAVKTKTDVLGIASIDREIVKERTNKKNPTTGKDIYKGKVVSESRKITFRDDNYTIDSKSRFAYIVDEIPLDADAFIKALHDALLKERGKSTPEEQEVVQLIADITSNAKDLFASGYSKDDFYSIVEAKCGTKLFNKVKDITRLKATLEAVKGLGN